MSRPAADFRNTSASWIGSCERGVEKIPEGVSFDRACFVEPVNTCLKGVVQLDPQPEDVVVILGQGPIGLIFTMLVKRSGATMLATDTMPFRRELARRFGAAAAFDPREPALLARIMEMTDGRGADSVIIAASAPGIVEQAVAIFSSGEPYSFVRADFASGTYRGFRRGCVRGRASDLRLLQRLGGSSARVSRSGIWRGCCRWKI